MVERVGVVGSNGFIGKALKLALEQTGTKVLGFNSSNAPLTIRGDLNEDLFQVHSIIWCATKVNSAIAESSPDLVRVEVQKWETFISLWKKTSASRQVPIIFMSSGGCVYSGSNIPFSESSTSTGTNAYGIMKSMMELILIEAEIPFKILRLANVYGPGQPTGRGQGVIAEWISSSKRKGVVDVYGSLDAFRDFIYIDDVTSAIISCIRVPNINDVFNIGSGKSTTLQEVLAEVRQLADKKLTVLHHKARSLDRQGYFLNINKAILTLVWEPNIPLKQGMRNCWLND